MAELDRNIPEVGLRFRNPEEGWLFWVAYGGRTGFDVRKRCTNVSKMDGNIQDRQGRNVVANPKLDAQLRYRFMSHKFHNLAHKVAHSPECGVLLENALDCLCTQLEKKLNLVSAGGTNEPCEDKENVDPNMQPRDDLLSVAQLKKKEVQSNKSRRTPTWIDKLRKGKRKNPKSAIPTKKRVKKQNKNDVLQPQEQVQDDGSHKGINVELQQYTIISDFTQLVTAPSYDDDILCDQDLF